MDFNKNILILWGATDSGICCKVNLGIGQTEEDCDDQTLSGARCLKIAKTCYIDNIVVDAEPDCFVSDITMHTAIDPEYLFYDIATKNETLEHTMDWSCNDETDGIVFDGGINAEINTVTARSLCVLQKWMCCDVSTLVRELGDDGKWILDGMGGGLKLSTATRTTGLLTSDNSNIIVGFTSNNKSLPQYYVCVNDNSADSDLLIEGISSDAV